MVCLRRGRMCTCAASLAACRLMALVLMSAVSTAVLVMLAAPGALAKEFSVVRVDIHAAVQSDGSLLVREDRTFRFDGEFSRVRQWIPLDKGISIEDIRVFEGNEEYRDVSSTGGAASTATGGAGSADERIPGTYRVTRTADQVEVAWYFRAEDEDRTFSLAYRMQGAVVSHNDVAELYWKCIGDQWDVSSEAAHVTIDLPPGAAKEDIRAWAHGPLWGVVSIDSPTRVALSVAPVPAKTFVEARVLFPKSLVPAATRSSGRDALAAILEEEGELARQANLARQRAAEREAQMARLRKYNAFLAPGVPLLALAFWLLFLYRRYDREYRPEFKGDYYRELPATYTPAELGVLWHFGSPSAADFTATILDLARRGYLTIEERRTERKRMLGLLGTATDVDYVIRATGKGKDDTLLEHEKALYNILLYTIGDGQSVTFDEITAYAKKKPGTFAYYYRDWQAKVRDDAKRNDFFDSSSSTGRLVGVLCGIGLVLAGVGLSLLSFAFVVSSVTWAITGVIIVILSAAIKRRSRKGQNEFAMWRAFRRFLLDFSSLHDVPVPALALWEHYLVYATALGVARQVIEQLKVVFPELSQPGAHTGFAQAWLVSSASTDLGSALTGLTTSLEHAIATSLESSSSGSGGGFSGGGGGGAGGGGGSAD